ncbi:PfaD family polyunsaturated fatty acid/polyketide biosynthesis protein [Spartinivicinus poritis]|uniref:PfaD family polyunsaturated fatty acid/polyketide biosynthesis protein n=1 Tax=Spartinivicinus poritis TaxID=2994640 RepID=A0ABT5UBS6_9GAMM|nr:PfaD family polyunsaturated fatty acid/polyketide biosynthesis protein [Spartinivicinus sp. A2-2]MDE1462569.1 PfaD family polyunsaturated fatty acid/polyketide biosynthesis protein [Spartinivicinus sp. A2-2]
MFDSNSVLGDFSTSKPLAITAGTLGSSQFKSDYGIRYAYLAGSMYKGIGSADLVIAMGKAGLLGYLGTGGMKLAQIESSINKIQSSLTDNQAYGLNLLYNPTLPDYEMLLVNLYLQHKIRHIEAAAYMRISPGLVRFRLNGLHRNKAGQVETQHRILAKVSRPEVAEAFMQPAPQAIVQQLVASQQITHTQAELSQYVPISDDICVEADSGGHTDQGIAYTLMPAMQFLRDQMMAKYRYRTPIRIGAAGGIGTPQAAAAAFILGADFILTGSINQCTVEADTSDAVKNLLQAINVQDTDYAPAGDMFELGAKVQVLKKGVFFPARANKLYSLYQQYDALESLDGKTQHLLQEKFFKRSFADVWAETKAYYLKANPQEIEQAERFPKHKMALVFKWYFIHSNRLAMQGSDEQKVDYQVHTGPALGAFNQWVKGTELEHWQKRHVAEIAEKIMHGTAEVLSNRFRQMVARH